MTDEPLPEVDLTLTPEEMLRIRDRVRHSLVTEFHEVNIALRARRKVGDVYTVRRLQEEIRRIVRMIHALDNPMDR
jgi:hypothetical protein